MKKKISLILLGIILLVAAFLRLYRIADYMTFLGDEGRDVLVVYNILHGHFTLLGPTASVGGFFLGPIYYYFMAPFLWLFNYNPVGPAVMIAIFGVITVGLVYFLGSTIFNRKTGLLAALIYSISPVVIAYSRSSWNPNLMPIVTIFTLWSVYKGLQKNSVKWFFVSGIFLGILMQLHYLATFVGAIIFAYIPFVRFTLDIKEGKKLWPKSILTSFKEYIFTFSGFIIGLLPYLAFEARHGFPNTQSIIKFIFHSQEVSAGGNGWMIVENVFFRLFGRLITNFPPPEQVSLQAHPEIFIWYILTLILGLLSTGYFVYKYIKVFNKKEKFLQYSLLFFWFFLGIILFGFYKKTIYDYYFEFLFPLPFLLVAYFLSSIFTKNIVFKLLAVIVVGLIIYMNVQANPFKFAPNKQLDQMKKIAMFVLSKTNDNPYNFALITGGNSDQAYRYFFTLENKAPTTILNPAIDPQRKSVTDQLFVVCETQPCYPLGNSLWEVAGFGRADIADKWNVSVVTVYKLVHYQEGVSKK